MRWVLLVCALAAACGSDDDGGPAGEGDLPIEPRFEELAARIDAERIIDGAPGAAVLMMEGGEVVFAHGFGTRVHGGAEPADAATLFRIGSVTKVLTAVALLQQVEAGAVGLDDAVTTVVPEFSVAAPAGGAATIRVAHLLTHASALADYLLIDDRHDDAALDEYLTGDYTALAYLMAPAGRMWNYSNPNFYLAGLVAERRAGLPYRELMRTRVLAPLGMDRTFFLPEETLADGNVASGRSTNTTIPPDDYDNAWGRPAGYAFSSVYDLGRFVDFLRAGDAAVLPDAARLAMQAPQIDTRLAAGHVAYGHGLFVYDGFALDDGYHEVHLIEHGGDIPGYAASMFYVPSTGFAFISLASGDGAHFRGSAGYALERFAGLGAPVPAPADLAIDPATFASLAGSYRDDLNAGRVEITVSGETVTISMPDVDAAGIPYEPELTPIRPDMFVLQVQGNALPVTFLRDAGGAPAYLRTRAFVAARVAGATGARRAIDADRLRRALATSHPLPLLAAPH